MDNLRKLQILLLNKLKDFNKFCKNNNIQYSLFAGTLLGAIREKGFIPWDDDIDLLITRDNYEKLHNLLKLENQDEFVLDETFWVPRIIFKNTSISNENLSIDLFILDAVPNNKIVNKIKIIKLKVLQGMIKKNKINGKKYNLLQKIQLVFTRFIGLFFSNSFKIKKYMIISKKGNNKNTKYLNFFNGEFKELMYRFPVDCFDDYKMVMFEKIEFPIFIGYDKILSTMYGNYMIPIKEESKHHKILK